MPKIEFDPGNTQFPEGAKDMTVDITDFIGVFEKAYSKEWCESTMKYFDRMDQLGFGRSIQDIIGTPRHLKDTNNFNTSRLYSQGDNMLSIVGVPAIQDVFLETFWACYNGIYRQMFSSHMDPKYLLPQRLLLKGYLTKPQFYLHHLYQIY